MPSADQHQRRQQPPPRQRRLDARAFCRAAQLRGDRDHDRQRADDHRRQRPAGALDGAGEEQVVDDVADQRELQRLDPVGARELAPAAAERADQADGGLVLRRAHLQRLAAVRELAAARVQQLELAHEPVAVARVRQHGRARRGIDGLRLRAGLVGEQAQRRRAGPRRPGTRPAPARGSSRRRRPTGRSRFCTPASRRPPSNSGSDSSAPTPQARADHLNRSPRSVDAKPPFAVSATSGNHAALRDADARLRGEHRALRGRDIGAARQHRARDARRHARQRAAPLGLGERERRGQLAEQHRERVLELRAAAVEREGLRFGRRDLGLHAREVELGHVAGAVAALGQAQRVAVRGDGLAHQRAFVVERAQHEVGLRHVRLHEQPRALQQRLARLRIERGGVAGLREAAEQVGLPRRVRARR